MPSRGRIVVVGAGIAGLTAALCLARSGFSVDIYERATDLQEVGAGLQLSPNAVRVLSWLGLADGLVRHAVVAKTVKLKSGRSGRQIAAVSVGGHDGASYMSIHRADLQAGLAIAASTDPAINLHLGQELVGAEPGPKTTLLVFRNGKTDRQIHAEIVVAADGVRSRVAEALVLPPPVDTRTTAWRMTVPAERIAADRPAFNGIEAWLGAGRHAVAYPIRQGREVNVVLIVPSDGAAGSAPAPVEVDRLAREFRSWDSQLQKLIAAGGPALAWPMYVVDDKRPWRHDNILLIGDAAHAMLPYAAQGAAMAIEDGCIVAHALAKADSPAAAFELYETLRRPRIDRVRSRVRFHEMVYHLPFPLSLGRDAVLGLKSPTNLGQDLAWLYGWTPPVA
ncbi:FAD-dependent oxidoreductase [Consotaella aegiceratis]|uniref:FAD-dependent oxidoreductase n=1 Tax=Consotaella aegiceratis TaxID=3097961 RepID=UPI002F401A9F